MGRGDFLQRLQNAARVNRHCVVDRIDVAKGVHPRERDHHVIACAARRCRARHAGVAALRHDFHIVCNAPAHELCHVVGRVRLRDGERSARPLVSPIG